MFTERNNFTLNAETLVRGGGRASEFGIQINEKLLNACVVPLLDYHSSVWGYRDYSVVDSIQSRSVRHF